MVLGVVRSLFVKVCKMVFMINIFSLAMSYRIKQIIKSDLLVMFLVNGYYSKIKDV